MAGRNHSAAKIQGWGSHGMAQWERSSRAAGGLERSEGVPCRLQPWGQQLNSSVTPQGEPAWGRWQWGPDHAHHNRGSPVTAAPYHPAAKRWGSPSRTWLGVAVIANPREGGQSPAHPRWHRAPVPSTGMCGTAAKAGGSEIQGHGVAGGDKHWWSLREPERLVFMWT